VSITFKKQDEEGDKFTAVDDRFEITAERTPSGYIRGWSIFDTKESAPPKGRRGFAKNRKAAKEWIESRMRLEPPEDLKAQVAAEIKSLLHAHRDCLRNIGVDTTRVRFDVRDGYYGEAFGMLRTMRLMGFGDWGPSNVPGNLKHWLAELEKEVLEEENFGGSGVCEWCREKWGKDDAMLAERKAREAEDKA